MSLERINPEVNLISYGRYFRDFVRLSMISAGGFGLVEKARMKSDNRTYAIKKIAIHHNELDYVIREIKLMANLNNDSIVKFKSSWIEENYMNVEEIDRLRYQDEISYSHLIFDPLRNLLVHFQMELYQKNLKDLLEPIQSKFLDPNFNFLNPIGYYIASEIFKEILEGVHYLHESYIIHRDLKPANIFLSNGINGRFVKIGDFGLSVTHEFNDQSHTEGIGTVKYMAPEVARSRKYDALSDIYSLGRINEDLFCLRDIS